MATQAELDAMFAQAVILAPAASSRNVIQPTAGAVIAAIVKAHAAQSVDLTQWQLSDATVLASISKTGAWLIQPSVFDAPALRIKARSDFSGSDLPVFDMQDTEGNSRFKVYVYTFGESGEADTYLTLSHGEGNAANEFSQIDWDWARKGDVSGAKSSWAITAQSFSDTSGFWGVNPYVPGGSTHARYPFHVDWATSVVTLGASAWSATDRGGAVLITSIEAGRSPLLVRAPSAPTADILGLLDSSHVVLSRFDKDGYLFTRKLAAPADGDVVNGEGGWWWDQANSLPKWKGKTSGGVVVNLTPVASSDLSAYVAKSLFDANTILAATSDDTPAALTVAASTFVGRKASGNIAAMTAAEAKTVLAIAESDVTSLTTDLAAKVPNSLFDANTVLAANTDDTPAAVTMGASTVLARLASGNIKAASVAEMNTLLGTSAPIAQGRASYGAGPTKALIIPGVQATGAATTYTESANRARYSPFEVRTAITFDAIVVELVTGVAASTMRWCIYNADINWQPTTMVAGTDTGAITTTAAAQGLLTNTAAAATLPPGRYLFWTNASTGNPVTRCAVGNFCSLIGYGATLGASMYFAQIYVAQTYGAPPSTGLAWDTVSTSAVQNPSQWSTFLRVTSP